MAACGELAQHIKDGRNAGGIIGRANMNFAFLFSKVIVMSRDEDNLIGQNRIGARKDANHILPVAEGLLELSFARPGTKAGSAEAGRNVFAGGPRTLRTGSAAFEFRTGQKSDVAAEILPGIRLRYRTTTD